MNADDKTRFLGEAGGVSVGTQLSGIYELDELLASGGMGEVYRGHNIQTGDLVAIKIVLPEFARDQTILSLFKREASILNHLSHDAIVRYHVFTIDPGIGRPYLAMEFVNGESLFDVMRRGPMASDDVRKLCMRLASALGAVHQEEIFHRDLSPDNVILPAGRVDRAKIIDFGIARSKVGEGTLIGGRFAGKYNYVSPEQLGLYGADVREQSDVYSLGLVLAAALRGKPIDMGGSQWEVVEKRKSLPALGDIDPGMRPILEHMLQPDPNDRPASMAKVVEMVRAGLSVEGPATQGPVGYPHGTSQLRHPDGDVSGGGNLQGSPRPASAVSTGPLAVVGSGSPEQGKRSDEASQGFVAHVRPAILDQPPSTGPGHPARRSRRPLVATLTGLVLLAGVAATGAYFGGLLDRPDRDGSATTSPPPETAAPPEAGNSAGEPAGEEAPPPATPPSENPPPDTGDTVVAPPAEEPLSTPPAETENEPAAPPPSTGPDATSPSPGPVPPPPEPPEQISEIADQISWLRTYSGGDCFYVAVTSATGKAIGIEGFGSKVQPFMDMLEAFRSKFQVEPSVGVRLIDPVQCPVTGFLRDIGESMSAAPQLTLDRTFIATGTPISGELAIPAGQKIHLLLIDHKGMVFNLDQRVDLKSGKASFSVPIGLGAADQTDANGVPLVLIALASDSDIQAAALQAPEPAAKALSSILTEMQTRKLAASATAKYFRLKP